MNEVVAFREPTEEEWKDIYYKTACSNGYQYTISSHNAETEYYKNVISKVSFKEIEKQVDILLYKSESFSIREMPEEFYLFSFLLTKLGYTRTEKSKKLLGKIYSYVDGYVSQEISSAIRSIARTISFRYQWAMFLFAKNYIDFGHELMRNEYKY